MGIDLFSGPKGPWILIDFIVSLLAIVANFALIDALSNAKLRIKGYRVFSINLGVTNIINPVTTLLGFAYHAMQISDHLTFAAKCMTGVLRSLHISLHLNSTCWLLGFFIDHYIGIVHPARYPQIIMNRASYVAVAVWVITLLPPLAEVFMSILALIYEHGHTLPSQQVKQADIPEHLLQLARNQSNHDFDYLPNAGLWDEEAGDPVSDMDSPLPSAIFYDTEERERYQLCSYLERESVYYQIFLLALTLLALLCLVYIYFITFRRMAQCNVGHLGRALVNNSLFLLGSLLLCFVPFLIFETNVLAIFLLSRQQLVSLSSHLFLWHNLFSTLLILKPLLDPIIFVIRIPTIREFFSWRLRCIFGCRHCRDGTSSADASLHSPRFKPLTSYFSDTDLALESFTYAASNNLDNAELRLNAGSTVSLLPDG